MASVTSNHRFFKRPSADNYPFTKIVFSLTCYFLHFKSKIKLSVSTFHVYGLIVLCEFVLCEFVLCELRNLYFVYVSGVEAESLDFHDS